MEVGVSKRRNNGCFVFTATCRDDLGMNSGAIPDSAINASSSYDFKSVGPQNSRSTSFVPPPAAPHPDQLDLRRSVRITRQSSPHFI